MTKLIPTRDLREMRNQGLILSEEENIGFTDRLTFHPIIMNAISENRTTHEGLRIVTSNLRKRKQSAESAYYLFICYLRLGQSSTADNLLYEHWLEFAEMLGSHVSLSLIENRMIDKNELELYYMSLYSGIIRIYRGSPLDLLEAKKIFKRIYYSTNIPADLNLLSLAEWIECIRKISGPAKAIDTLKHNIDNLNKNIELAKNNMDKFEEKNLYCFGTTYFLLANVLRFGGLYYESIQFYKEGLKYLGSGRDRNAALQVMHSHYGIAEAQLKQGNPDIAIATIDWYFQSGKIYSYFGQALMLLLRGRAFLMIGDYSKGNYNSSKAALLFRYLNLPYYYERCQLVIGAINLRKGNNSRAKKILSKLSETSDGTLSLGIRARLLLSTIQDSELTDIKSDLTEIMISCGLNIALTYFGLIKKKLDGEFSFMTTKGVGFVLDNGFIKMGLSTNNYDTYNNEQWLID